MSAYDDWLANARCGHIRMRRERFPACCSVEGRSIVYVDTIDGERITQQIHFGDDDEAAWYDGDEWLVRLRSNSDGSCLGPNPGWQPRYAWVDGWANGGQPRGVSCVSPPVSCQCFDLAMPELAVATNQHRRASRARTLFGE